MKEINLNETIKHCIIVIKSIFVFLILHVLTFIFRQQLGTPTQPHGVAMHTITTHDKIEHWDVEFTALELFLKLCTMKSHLRFIDTTCDISVIAFVTIVISGLQSKLMKCYLLCRYGIHCVITHISVRNCSQNMCDKSIHDSNLHALYIGSVYIHNEYMAKWQLSLYPWLQFLCGYGDHKIWYWLRFKLFI